jgi:hypothetical protein
MARVKDYYHDELERRRAYEDEMFDEEAISAAEDRAWAAAKAAKRLAEKAPC